MPEVQESPLADAQGALMAQAPKCKLCGARHWNSEPHVFDGKQASSRSQQKSEPVPDFSKALVQVDPRHVIAAADNPDEGVIALLGQAKRWLLEATQVEVVVKAVAWAEGVKAWKAKQREAKEAKRAAEDFIRHAERKIGELVALGQEEGTVRKPGRPIIIPAGNNYDDKVPASLTEIGITSKQLSDFKALASVDEPVFEEALERLKDEGTLSRAALLREFRGEQKENQPEAERAIRELYRLADHYDSGDINLRIRREIEHLEALTEMLP